MITTDPTPAEQQWMARQILFFLGELRPRDLSTDEILQLNYGILASISNRTLATIWRTLQQRRCSFAQIMKFFKRTDWHRAPPSVWKTVIAHRRCTFTGLYKLHLMTKDHDVCDAIKKVIHRREDWQPADLWRQFQRLDHKYGSSSAREGIAEAIAFRKDCPSDILLEIAKGGYYQASTFASSTLRERADCPLDFLLQHFLCSGYFERRYSADKSFSQEQQAARRKMLATLRRRRKEIRQLAQGTQITPAGE